MEAVDHCMPQARRQALARKYKSAGVALSRRRRGGLPDEEEDQEEEVCFGNLPTQVVEAVLRQLDPLTLAAAACVSREWRHLACDDRLWRPLLKRTFGSHTTVGSARQQFAAAAAQSPAALLQWQTNRVEHLRGRRLGWLDRSRPLPPNIRYLTPAQAVRQALGSISSGSSSDEASGSEGEDDAALGSRFRFWQL